MSWQPIETAPKDGTWILGYDKHKGRMASGLGFTLAFFAPTRAETRRKEAKSGGIE